MKNLKAQLIIQLTIIVLGIGIGLHFSMKSTSSHAATHLNTESHSTMNHGLLDISSDSIIPQIQKLKITKDPISGWNLNFQTAHFQFTPENASTKHEHGKGHAHLLINGKKVARLYANWFHIPELEYELNEVEVTLNSNTHAVLAIDGNPISTTLNNHELVGLDFTLCNK